MAIRQVRIDGDPILRKVSREVKRFDDRLKLLVEDMFDTMYYEEGIGLAAPQIGILRRIIVIDIDDEKYTLINPKILKDSGCAVDMEGCLSVPNMQGEVERPVTIKVEYQDVEGESKELEAEDLLARAICHEIDHLNGVLYRDIATQMYTVSDSDEEV